MSRSIKIYIKYVNETKLHEINCLFNKIKIKKCLKEERYINNNYDQLINNDIIKFNLKFYIKSLHFLF